MLKNGASLDPVCPKAPSLLLCTRGHLAKREAEGPLIDRVNDYMEKGERKTIKGLSPKLAGLHQNREGESLCLAVWLFEYLIAPTCG